MYYTRYYIQCQLVMFWTTFRGGQVIKFIIICGEKPENDIRKKFPYGSRLIENDFEPGDKAEYYNWTSFWGSGQVQHYVDHEYMGRVMSLFMMQFGFASFSTFLAGLLAQGIGVQWAIGGFAMALALLSILVLVFVPRIRKLE